MQTQNSNRKFTIFGILMRSEVFTLPEDVKQDKVEAKYTDGALHLSLPKKEKAKEAVLTRQINIQ